MPDQEELTVRVFTANYSRTFRLADRPFPVKAIDSAYVARSQQNAIRRLDLSRLRPVLDQHLATGEPWWGAHVREDERIQGGHGVGLSKTGSASSGSARRCSSGTARPASSPVRSHREP